MNPGTLRHSIIIQNLVETQDAAGEPIESWVDFPSTGAKHRAAVETLTSREYFAAQQVNAENTMKIRIRYIPGLTAKMRVIFEGRTLEIAGPPIDQENRHRELLLMCTEVA